MTVIYKCLFIYTMVFDTSVSHVILIVIDGIYSYLLATALQSLFCETHLQWDLVRRNGLSRLFSTLDSLCASGIVSDYHQTGQNHSHFLST